MSRVTSSTRVTAIQPAHGLGQLPYKVDAIEAAAGLDILSALPLSVQNIVEVHTDTGPTN